MSARSDILRRAAAGAGEATPVPRDYRVRGTLDLNARVALLCERIGDYRAEVRRVGDVSAAVADVCHDHGVRRLGIPAGLPSGWRPSNVELVEDDLLATHELDQLDGALTGCTVAIAETGTLVLTAASAEGRRALTLVPDLHICVVAPEQVVELVPEAMAALATHARRPITFVSGPSATSDIELSRVEGVHGPRRLVVLVTSKERT